MRCNVCGAQKQPLTTDLPFKVGEQTIVVLKGLPVLQCRNCSEYLLDNTMLGRVEEIFHSVKGAAELEVIRYAA
jgi:YgiT-type zinc finger domain-containing protein